MQHSTHAFLEREHRLFIGNEWMAPANRQSFDTLNPADGQVLTTVALAEEADVDQAVAVARQAFVSEVRDLAPRKRGRLMHRLADLLERDTRILMELECLDNGKPISKAGYDVKGAINHLRYYAGWATKIEGSHIPVTSPDTLVYTRREPLGVVGLIVPWNFPLMMAAWKLGPALACGNCCILKPAEQTPLTALYLGDLVKEAGFPVGMVNILTGPGSTGAALCHHMDVDKIGFTGSTEVGRKVMAAAAQSNLKKVSLELGGKSPNIIFADADLERVAQSLVWSSYYNSGQECTLGSRVYVQRGVYDPVVENLMQQAQGLSLGVGMDDPDLGPLISDTQLQRVLGYIDTGKTEAELLLGGARADGALARGYFVEPTLFSTKANKARIVQEEIFGPVVTVTPFDAVEEVVAHANDSRYGLAAAVWTQDISKAHRAAHALQAGTVWINGYDLFNPAVPFGGYKESGLGREMGKSAIELYTQQKAVWVAL